MIEIRTIGGYQNIGKNMTAIKVDNDVILLDMGIDLEKYILVNEDIENATKKDLLKAKAIPNLDLIKDWLPLVRAIIPTHAHLDHIGAIPFLAEEIKCPIYGTPFTCEVIKTLFESKRMKLKNPLRYIQAGNVFNAGKIKVEFVQSTHSTPQTVMAAIHTKYGIILYANDFKFDSFPTLGKKPNFKRLEELGKEGIIALIADSTYAPNDRKTPSESVAKQMLKDVMLGTIHNEKAIIVSTYSSHLARLKSIYEFANEMGRKPVFIGRSMEKYISAGRKVNLFDFKGAEIVAQRDKINKRLRYIQKRKNKYVLIATGHQGEKKAMLSRMIEEDTPCRFERGDMVIFSCNVIPTKMNIKNREILEKKLRKKDLRIFTDIHASGHASKEDLRDLLLLTKPKHIIPSHGDAVMRDAFKELCHEMGMRNVHIDDKTKIVIK